MKTCIRCNGRLDSASKAARSEVCTACGVTSGDCQASILLPVTRLETYGDVVNLLTRERR